MQYIYPLFRETFREFRKHNVSQMAASLAYFGLFATAPIIFITITILNIFLNDLQIRYTLLNEINTATGPQVANIIQTILINNSEQTQRNIFFEIITAFTLLFSATTLVIQLQQILNTLWDIQHPKKDTLIKGIFTRIISLIAIIIASIAIYIFFIISIAINLLGSYFDSLTGFNPWLLLNLNLIISFFFIIGVLSSIFKYIPSAKISWLDAIVGGTVTASLFTLGRYILTFYFNRSVMGSIYGTAGTLLVFLAWIYFSALIFLFGAQFTHIHAKMLGKGVSPK